MKNEEIKLLKSGLPVCYSCQKEIPAEEESKEHDGETYHEECFNDDFWYCENCEKYFSSDEDYKDTPNNGFYCQDCFNDNYFECEGCNEAVSNEDSYSATNSDYSYCQSCYNDRYRTCDECGEDYETDDGGYCDECETSFCNNCHCRCGGSQEFDNFLTGRSVPEFPFKEYVGVEIECFGDNSLSLPEETKTASDGSISPDFGEGNEIKTYPASGDKFLSLVRETCEELQNEGYKVNNSCGLHIHIDAKKYVNKPIKLSHWILTYYAFEDCLYSMLPKSRWDNTYSKPLHNDYTFEELKAKTEDKLERSWYHGRPDKDNHDDHTRYHAFNLHSVFYRGSLEIRAHSGTIEPEKIINWAYILLKIKKWADKKYKPAFVEKMANQSMGEKKLKIFLKTFGLDKNKKLREYIKARVAKFNPATLQARKTNYWTLKFDYNQNKAKMDNLYSLVRERECMLKEVFGDHAQQILKRTIKGLRNKVEKIEHIQALLGPRMKNSLAYAEGGN